MVGHNILRFNAHSTVGQSLAVFIRPTSATGAIAEDTPIVGIGTGSEQAPGTPVCGSVTLYRTTIPSSASGRIEDVLTSVAGFQQVRRSDSPSSHPSAQGVTLRALGGNATSRALILLDGVPMADPFIGHVPLPAILSEGLTGALSDAIGLDSAGPGQFGLLSAQAMIDQRDETEANVSLTPRLEAGFAVISGRWDGGQSVFIAPVAKRCHRLRKV